MEHIEQIKTHIVGIYDYDDVYIENNPILWDRDGGVLYISPLFCGLLTKGKIEIEDDGEMMINQGIKTDNKYVKFELEDERYLNYFDIKKIVLIENDKETDEIVIEGKGKRIFKFRCLDEGRILTLNEDNYFYSIAKFILLDGIKENIEDTNECHDYVREVARMCEMINKIKNKPEEGNINVKQITCHAVSMAAISYYIKKAKALRKWGLDKLIIYCNKYIWESYINSGGLSVKKNIRMVNSKGQIVDEFPEWGINGEGSDIKIVEILSE